MTSYTVFFACHFWKMMVSSGMLWFCAEVKMHEVLAHEKKRGFCELP